MHKVLKQSVMAARLMVILAALMFATACPGPEPQPTQPGTVKPVEPQVQPVKKVTLADVEMAFNSGDLALAEKIATEFTSRTDVDKAELGRGWRILALSSAENRHPMVAITALDRWRITLPKADSTEEWYSTWYSTLTQLPFAEADKRARAVIDADAKYKAALEAAKAEGKPTTDIVEPYSWQQVREATMFLFETRIKAGSGRAVLPELETLYDATEQVSRKKDLEARLFKFLHTVSPQALQNMMPATSDENENRYPYALVRLENARRSFWDVRNQDIAKENVSFLRDGSLLADPTVFRGWNQPDYSVLNKVRVNNQVVAMVLPMTGPYGNLSERIVRGAEIARQGLERNGKNLRLHVIDSDQPNWITELAALPPYVRVVGGPLRLDDYTAVKNMGFTGNRFFFTFLPRMDDNDEGLKAWRFFPSREDQIRVMLDYSTALGLDSYAVFAPDTGEYNQSMFDLFYSMAAERDAYIIRAGYYPAGQYQQWAKSVASFLSVYTDVEKEEPQVLDFQAMFLPDNWSNSSRIISHVFYSIENNLLFMGTNLWEHGLSGQQRLALRNYRLAVFPGAWDQQTLSPSGQLLRGAAALNGKYTADFWGSLGYDFMLMAATLNLPAGQPSAEDVNAALHRLPQLPWSGAPITWDEYGFAKQELFVLTPAENGFTRANIDRIKARLAQPLTPAKPGASGSNGANGAAAPNPDAE